jgi:rod shape determining protein RodA
MTVSALTRPGERDRLIVKLGEIDWIFCLLLSLIVGAAILVQFSIAGSQWMPWALPTAIRYTIFFAIMIVLSLLDLRVWFALAYPIYGVGFLLLIAVDLVGHHALGAQRWLQLGPIQIQPSEIMKIGLVLALARFYHSASSKTAQFSWWLLWPAFLILAPVALVLKQPDLGTAILVALTGGTVMILGGLSWRVIAAGAVGAVAMIPPVVMFALHGYQKARVTSFLNPEADPSGAGYHSLQSAIAIGSGGLLGKGYGLGSQSELNFLPEKQTDFIFSSLAEQFGFVGCVSLLLLYAAVIFMALRIAYISHSHFGRLAAAGITVTFTVSLLINGAMVLGLAPVVGVPMPLLSYGGTVMLTLMVGFGLVQGVRVHRYSEVTSGKGALM